MKLEILPPIDLVQLGKLEEHLRQAQGLRLILVGGSADEGTRIVVSVGKGTPLVDVLRELPTVEQVAKKGDEIQIRLKAK